MWQLRITIHCLADAGNLLDCACLAGIAALKHFRRPEIEVVGDEVTVVCLSHILSCLHRILTTSSLLQHPPSSRAPVPLSLHHTPFCITFAYFPSPSHPHTPTCLLDPSHLEQRLSTGTLSLALNAQRELCVVHKAGGLPLAPEEVLRAVEVAVGKARELERFLEGRLREDWKGRNVEVR